MDPDRRSHGGLQSRILGEVCGVPEEVWGWGCFHFSNPSPPAASLLCLLSSLCRPSLVPRTVPNYFFVPCPSGVLYWLLPFHSHCSMLPPKHQSGMCLMLLWGGSPGSVPSNKERWTCAGVKHDLVFLIHLNSGASALCHQALNFLVGAAL